MLRLSVMQWILIQVSSAVISAEQDGENLCRRLEHMKGHRILHLVAAIFFLACACVSCESGSSSSSDYPAEPWQPIGELVGSWFGYFYEGENGLIDDDFSTDPLDEPDDDDVFTIGIITPEREARFIGDDTQYVCLENSLGIDDSLRVRTIFSGFFDHYTYASNTGGIGPYAADVKTMYIQGNAVFTIDNLYGFYCDDVKGADMYYWEVINSMNATTAGVTADIEKLAGDWEISNSFYLDNTLAFTITPMDDESGLIIGEDTLGNTFEGTIIEIHYDDTDLYDVSLKLNEEFDLEGLATYVSSYDNQGIHAESSLAIGVSDGQRMVTGLAAPVPEE